MIARRPILPCVLAALALAACGSQRSTLPPAPGSGGEVPLRDLAHHPEVYADATVSTTGTVARTRIGHMRLYALAGSGGGARIVLEPTAAFARDVGRRVRVDGLFTVTFTIGYELLASRVTPVDSL